MRSKPANSDREVAAVAGRQHGVITRAQLEAVGVTGAAISRRVAAGRLHRLHRAVYAVGHTRLSFEGRCLAAALACGAPKGPGGVGAVVSHRSAAALWGMLAPASGPIDVTVRGRGGRCRRSGIAIHRSLTLSRRDTTRRHLVPVTGAIRTLVDLRRNGPAAIAQTALRRALDLGVVNEADLVPDPDLTRSELERLFLRLCRRHRLPKPEVNARLGAYEVDFLWRDARVVVETDGFRHHRGRFSFERDRARDVDLQVRGYRVLRFTYRQVRESAQVVAGSIRRVLRAAG